MQPINIARISKNQSDGPGALAFERFVSALTEAEGLSDPDEVGLKRMAQQIDDIRQTFREKALGQGDVQSGAVSTVEAKISCKSCELWNDDKRHCKLEGNLEGDALIARVMAEGCNIYSAASRQPEPKRPLGAIRQASVRGDIEAEAVEVEKPKLVGGFTVLNANRRGQPIRRRE